MELSKLRIGDVITFASRDGETGIQEILEINGSRIKRRIIRCDWLVGVVGNETWCNVNEYPPGWKLDESSMVERILEAYE